MNSVIKFSISFLLLTCFACIMLFAQNKSADYQTFLANAQVLLDKQPETFSKDDLAKLDDLINLDVNRFGEENVRLTRNLIEQAKKKKIEYEQYLVRMKNMSATLDTLDSEVSKRKGLESDKEELMLENKNLKQTIDDLKDVITRFEKQEKKIRETNSRLQKENLIAKDLLKESSDIIAQMLMLMNNNMLKSDSIPQTLIDSLEEANCSVAQLLKENFLITIQQLKINQQFMDSAHKYYKINYTHLLEVQGYIENADKLVQKLKKSNIDCAIRYANDIEIEMLDFIDNIENLEDTNSFTQFIINNIYWLATILLILIIGIIILIRNTSKKVDKEEK